MKICIAYSHVDAKAALRLLLWIHHLGGADLPLVVVATRLSHRMRYHALIAELLGSRFTNAEHVTCRTENERGWPWSATHLFGESLWYCSGYDMAWVEPDALPLKPDWFEKLKAEFARGGRPFMGKLVPKSPFNPDHMAGTAIYGKDWERHAPNLPAPSRTGTGAWDVDCAQEILACYHDTELIQHRWVRPKTDRRVPLNILRPDAVLFHQDKLGYLPFDLDPGFAAAPLTLRYPSVLLGSNAMHYFLNQKANAPLEIGGKKFQFEPALHINGETWGTLAVSDPEGLNLMEAQSATGRVKEISKDDYDKYEVKKKNYSAPKNSFALPNLTNQELPRVRPEPAQPAATVPVSTSVDDVLTPKPIRSARKK